jgi:hypothetical protein
VCECQDFKPAPQFFHNRSKTSKTSALISIVMDPIQLTLLYISTQPLLHRVSIQPHSSSMHPLSIYIAVHLYSTGIHFDTMTPGPFSVFTAHAHQIHGIPPFTYDVFFLYSSSASSIHPLFVLCSSSIIFYSSLFV